MVITGRHGLSAQSAPAVSGKWYEYLGIEHIDLFNNGTIARLTAHSLLSEVKGNRIVEEPGQRVSSKFYFPILVEPDYPLTRNGLYQWLRHENIFS